MSSFEEEDELTLVIRLVWQVVRQSSFPPPGDHDSWTETAVMDQAVDLYLHKGAAIVAEAKAAAGGDQGHLERRLLKTIRNYMIDVAKSTPVGLMRNRLATMLLRHPDYVRLDDAGNPLDGWASAGSPGAHGELWQGDEDAIHAAAARTPVPPGVKFNRSGPPPPVTKQALLDVITAIFTAAGGCYLPDQILARVIARRFDEFLDPDKRDVSDTTSPTAPAHLAVYGPADPTAEDQFDRVAAADAADWIWVEFSAEERSIYPFLDIPETPDARIAAVILILGCGEGEAEAILEAMFAKIRQHAPTPEFGRHILDELTAIYNREHPNGPPGGTP
jgi:hypothetical protein